MYCGPYILFIPEGAELGQEVFLADLGDNCGEIALVDISVIGIDYVLDSLGQAAHDVQVLGVGKPLHTYGGVQKAGIGLQTAAADTVDVQGAQIEAQTFINSDKGGLGDKAQVDGLGQPFQIDIGQAFQPEAQSEGIKFPFGITAIDRGNIHCDMTLIVDLLLGFKDLITENSAVELFQVGEQAIQTAIGITAFQYFQQIFHLRKTALGSLAQLVAQFLHSQIILVVEQLEHLHKQLKTAQFISGNIGLPPKVQCPFLYVPGQNIVHGMELQLISDTEGQDVLFINKGSADFDLTDDILGHIGAKMTLVQGEPKGKDPLDKTDNQVGGFHMGLLAEKMDQHIMAFMQLVQFGGDITQLSFGSDLVKEDRHQLGKLFSQIIDGGYGMVEQVGDVPLKEVGILDTGAGKLDVDDQGGKKGGTPFRLLHDQAEPGSDIVEMSRVGDGLPVLINAHDIGILEAETYRLKEKCLHQAGVAPFKDLAADDLDALQGGVGIFAYIGLEELEGGDEKLFNLFIALLPDELNQGTVDFTQGFLMDEVQPCGIHDAEEEDQFTVFHKSDVNGILINGGKFFWNFPVHAYDIHVCGQFQNLTECLKRVIQYINEFQGRKMLSDTVMGNGREQRSSLPVLAEISALSHKPGLRILLTQPVAVVESQDFFHKQSHRGAGKGAFADGEQLSGHFFHGMMTLHHIHHQVIVYLVKA